MFMREQTCFVAHSFHQKYVPGMICLTRLRPHHLLLRSNINLIIILKKPAKYYDTGSSIGQILHERLRMECSSLNAHHYRKNIVPSPTCSCGGFESTYHFFQCPNYAVTRRRYLSNYLPTLNTNQALYGKADASVVENEALFFQVQQFIIHSKRFVSSFNKNTNQAAPNDKLNTL